MSNIDLFDRYLKKELSDAARNDFNQKIKSDQFFAKEFAAHIEIKAAAKVARIVKESDKISDSPKRGKSIFLFIILFVITIIGFIFLFQMQMREKESLWDSESIAIVERSSGAENKLILDIEKSYNEGDFDKALIYINEALEFNQTDYELLFHKAICLRDSKNNPDIPAAIIIFNDIIEGSTLEEKAEWHKAVALYKNNQLEDARNLLEEIIAEPKHQKHKKAVRLLKEF